MSRNSSFGGLLFYIFALYIGFVFKLAFKLRIGFALLYACMVGILFNSWADQNPILANGIFVLLLAGGIISWVFTFIRWLRSRI